MLFLFESSWLPILELFVSSETPGCGYFPPEGARGGRNQGAGFHHPMQGPHSYFTHTSPTAVCLTLINSASGTQRASQVCAGKESSCQCRRHKRLRFNPWVGKIPWRRVWQPTPVFLPGESQRQRSSVGYSPENHTELHTTEVTQHNNHFIAITFIAPKK